MALEGAKTDRAGLGSSIAEKWSGGLSSQNSTEDKGIFLSRSSTFNGPLDTTAPAVLPGVVVSSTLFSSLWKVGKVEVAQLTQGYNLAHQAPSFSDSKLQPLEDEIRRLKKERGEIKELAFIPALDAKISRLEKAHQILKGLEVSPVFLVGVVHQILETPGEESEIVDQTLETLQGYKTSRRKVNDLILQVAQEYPSGSPLMFELDLSDRNPKVRSYDPGRTSNRAQMSAVDQPPLKTLQTFPIFKVYQTVWERSGEEAAHLRLKFTQLREEAETFPFGIDSLQAVQKESERLSKLADPVIKQFLTRVSEKRTEQLKQDSSYQDRLAFQETLGGVPIYEMIFTALASASPDFEVKPEMMISSREDWKKELEAQRKHLEFQAERFTGDHLIVDVKGWEKSSLKPIIDRLQGRMAEIDQQLQNLNPSQTYTPEGLYAALVQETKARVEFQEHYLQTLLEIKQYQVAQIPSSVEGDPLAQIGADLKQWSQSDNSLQDRLQQYAKYSEELDHIALGRSMDAKLKMLEAGTEVVAITDRAINGMMNAPHEYIAGEKLGDLANESSHLQAARFHYRGVQRLYNEGKFEEANKIFAALEQSVLTVDAQEKVEWSSTFNRYAVGVGIVAGAAAVAYTGGRIAAPVVGEGASLFVNSYLFWTTYNYLEGRSRGVQINPYYDTQKSIGQNSFDTTKNTLLTYGMFRFIGWFGKSYLEGAAKEIEVQAEKELAREAVLVEGKVFVQGSTEQLLIAQRVAVIQERLLTRLQLGVGAFKAEVKGLTAWDMVQQNIELALEKKFDPARVVWNNLFTPENWEHRVLFLAALKAEGKVSHALGYRQLAEAFADKAYQVRFERLENRIHTTQQQILALQLKSAEAGNRIPEDPVKMLALIRSYEKDLSTQLRLAKEMSPELLNPESLQLLAIRAQQLGEVKVLQAQYQAEADFNKAYGIKPVSTELAQYATAQGPALVKYWLDRGAKIEIANNGFITVRLQQGEQRYYPSDYSPETIAEMRKVLAPLVSDQSSSPFSNLIDGITAFFQGSPTAQKLGLTGQLLIFGGWDDANSSLSPETKLGLAVAGVLILLGSKVFSYLKTDTTEEKPLYVTRAANVDSNYLNAAKKFLKRHVKRYPKLKNLITSLGEENCLNALSKLTSPESTNQDPIHAFFFLLRQLTESQRIDFLLFIENHGSDTLILLNRFYPEQYQDGSPYWRYNNYFDERWLDLIKQGGAEVAYKAATLYKISPDYFDALSITKEKNLIILELENKEKYEALKSAASAFEGAQGKILKEMLNPMLNSAKSFSKDLEFQVMITALLYYPDHLIYALDTLPWRGNTYWAVLSSLFFIRLWTPNQVLDLIKDKDRLKNILPELEKEYSKWSQDHNNTKSQGAASTSKASQRSEHDLIMDRLIQEAVQFYHFSPKNTGEITRAEVMKRFKDWLKSEEGRKTTSDDMTQRKLYRSVLLQTFCDERLPDADDKQIADYIRAKKFEVARGR